MLSIDDMQLLRPLYKEKQSLHIIKVIYLPFTTHQVEIPPSRFQNMF
jgi:hypothetical protein